MDAKWLPSEVELVNSFFDTVEMAPDDPILSLAALFAEDQRSEKVNLGIGSYRTAEGSSYLLQAVSEAEGLLAKESAPRDYLPIEGDLGFLNRLQELTFGKNEIGSPIYGAQTIGGTSALHLAAAFLSHNVTPVIAVSTPTWSNHHLIFKNAGLTIHPYPYYDGKTHKIDLRGMFEALDRLPPSSAVLLQTTCHNPTGVDLNRSEWQEILSLCQKKHLLPFFDNAYQGFAASISEDTYPIELFLKHEMEMIVATSCSKNFGLYGERVGALFIVLRHAEAKKTVGSRFKQFIRSHYSTPPIHGAKVVAKILSDPKLRHHWIDELENMRTHVEEMRENFSADLISKSGSGAFSFLRDGKGFFSLLDISGEDVLRLRREKGIYMPSNGRINIAGLTPINLSYVVDAILSL